MSVDTDLKAALDSLVAGGCHNSINTDTSITCPYIVFYEIAGTPLYTITEYVDTTSRYQIDVFARTQEQAKGLALGTIKTAIEAALDARLIFQMNGEYSPNDKTYQYITEYRIET